MTIEHQLEHFGAGLLDARSFENWLYESDNNDWLEQRIPPDAFYTLLTTDYADGHQQMVARDIARATAMQINADTWRDAMALVTCRLNSHIDCAFADVQRGSGITIHEAQKLDDRASDEACEAARALDVETCWQDVRAAVIRDIHPIGFLDDIGFRYYIPAYMRWCLHNRQEDSDTHLFTLLALCRPGTDLRHRGLFTHEQQICVLNYIFWVSVFDDFYAREDGLLKLNRSNVSLYDRVIDKLETD